MTGVADEVVAVRLLDFPVEMWQRSNEHHRELLRELALVAMRPPDEPGHELPRRLTELVATVTERYTGLTESPDARRDAAAAAGEAWVDLDYTVPPSIAAACRDLGGVLDEADEYCRRGQHLLTLATPPELVRFRRWYLGEFIAQIERGAAPVPWPQWRDG